MQTLNRVDVPIAWGPHVVGRMKLDERRWSYGVRAPFDMAADIPELSGTKVRLDGRLFEIRGIVPSAPPLAIREGDLIELLVVALQDSSR